MVDIPISLPPPDRSLEEQSFRERAEYARNVDRMVDMDRFLKLAPTNSKQRAKLQEIVADHFNRSLLLGLAEVHEDGSIKWSSKDIDELRKKLTVLGEEFSKERERLKQKSSNHVDAFAKEVDEMISDALEAKQEYGDAKLVIKKPLDIDFAKKPFPVESEKLKAKRQIVIDLAEIFIRAEAEGKKRRDVLIEMATIEAKDKDYTILGTDPWTEMHDYIGDIDKPFTDVMKEDLLNTLKVETELQPIPDRMKLQMENAKKKLDEDLAKIDVDKKKLLIGRFTERAVYLEKVGGTNYPAMIRESLRIDYKFEPDLLREYLTAIGKTPVPTLDEIKSTGHLDTEAAFKDAAKEMLKGVPLDIANAIEPERLTELAFKLLTQGEKSIEKTDEYKKLKYELVKVLLSLWETKDLQDMLTKKYGENPTGISIAQYYARASIPPKVLESLRKNGVDQVISVRTLYKLTKLADIEKGDFTPQIAKEVLDIATAGQRGGVRTVDKKTLIDALAYLRMTETSDFKHSRSLREAEWNKWEEDKLVTKEPDGSYTAKEIDLINDIPPDPAGGAPTKIGKISVEDITTMRAAGLNTVTWTDTARMMTDEALKVSGVAVGTWWNWVSTLPRILKDSKIDGKLLEYIKQEDAMRKFRSAIDQLEKTYDRADKGMDDAFKTLNKVATDRKKAEKEATSGYRVTQNVHNAMLLEEASAPIFDGLKEMGWERIKDVDDRRAIFFVAMNRGLVEAAEYMDNPTLYKTKHPDMVAPILANINKIKKNLKLTGVDVLLGMENKLKVHVVPMALDKLSREPGPSGKEPISTDVSRIGSWMTNPAQAETALAAILYEEGEAEGKGNGAKNAMIDAFCNQKSATYWTVNETGEHVAAVITKDEATAYVADIQKHLQRQMSDRATSVSHLAQKNRFKDPIDTIRSASSALNSMLHGSDRIEQAMAIGLIVGVGYAIYKAWNAKGWKRNLLLGVPAFFGLDILLKRMTGEGIIDRAKLHFMDQKDRSAAEEDFTRRMADVEGYKDVGTNAGFEARKILMNSVDPVPVSQLLRWRQMSNEGGKNPVGSYKSVGAQAPDQVKASLQKVKKHFGNQYLRDTDRNTADERAYALILKTFDAVCYDVAVVNHLPEPKADAGALLIRERYVDLSEKYMTDTGYYEDMRRIRDKRGGFTTFDILIYERPTPAMKELLEHPYMVEFVAAKLGVAKDWLFDKLKQGKDWTEIQIEATKRDRIPDAIDAVSAVAADGYTMAKDYWKLFSTKGWNELTTEGKAAWNTITGLLSAAHITIRDNGMGALEMTLNGAAVVGSGALSVVQNIYREIQSHEVIGNVLDGFEQLLKNTFGADIADLLIMRSKAESEDAYVEKLSQRKRWSHDLFRQLGIMIDLPIKDIKTFSEKNTDWWIAKAGEDLGFISVAAARDQAAISSAVDSFDKLKPHQKMAIYELVKRRAFSLALAKRIDFLRSNKGKPVIYPLHDVNLDWNELTYSAKGAEPLYARDIVQSYDLRDLLQTPLLGQELAVPAGIFQKWEKEATHVTAKSAWATLHWLMDAVTRDKSGDYISFAVREYITPLMKQAEGEFGDDEEKREEYAAYLYTALANAVVEISLGELDYQRELKGRAMDNKLKDPLNLLVNQAQNFLEYLKLTRSSAPELHKIYADVDRSKIKLSVFDTSPYSEELGRVLAEVDKSVLPSTDPSLPAGPTVLTPAEIEAREREARAAKAVADTFDDTKYNNRNALPEILNTLSRLDDKPTRKKVEDELLKMDYFSNPSLIKYVNDLAARRNAESDEGRRGNLQHLLDRIVAKQLPQIIDEISKTPPAARTPGEKKGFETQLLQLYAATNPEPDRVSDMVSEVLESLVLDGMYSTPDPKTNETGYEKYESYLKSMGASFGHELKPPPREILEYPYGPEGWVIGNKFESLPARALKDDPDQFWMGDAKKRANYLSQELAK